MNKAYITATLDTTTRNIPSISTKLELPDLLGALKVPEQVMKEAGTIISQIKPQL